MNLQSPNEKKIIRKLKTFFVIKNISFLIASLLIIISTVFLFSYLLLQNYNDSLQAQVNNKLSILKEEKITSTEDVIQDLNNTINRVEAIQKKYILWTNFLNDFSALIPEGIRIDNMQFLNTSKNFQIKGFAISRDNFLLFKDNLSNFPIFDTVDTPISNLTQRENINFIITGKINENIYK